MITNNTYNFFKVKTPYNRFIILIVVLLFGVRCYSHSIITLTDTTISQFIGKSVYYIEDPQNQYNFPAITDSVYYPMFVKCQQENPNFGNVENTIWNKFTVVNTSSKKWFLSVLNYNIDTLEFYYLNNDGTVHKTLSGCSMPLSSRKFKSGSYNFELPVKNNDTVTFYLKVKTYLLQYPLRISSEEQFVYDLHVNNLLKGLYLGLVLLFIIYNTVLYIILRDKNYIYFNLNILFTALLMTEHAGINALLWGDQFHFLWNRGPLILAIGSFFFLLFSSSFLQTRKYAPRSHFTIQYILIPLVLLSMVCNLLDKNLYASILNQTTGLVILFFMTISAVVIYKKGNRFALFYIIACSFYFIGVVIYIMKTFAILPYTFFTSNSMELGSALEMILFSISMADRMNSFKKEKEIAQENLLHSLKENEQIILNQNKLLEIKVDERTSELQKTMNELEISEKELQQKNTIILNEKDRSEKLLLNILPEEVAEELKQTGTAEAKQFEYVTVMFTDFKDFTKVSEKLSPSELVNEIHTCFKAFDEIITNYNIEKIKTIGDAYMCVGGLPISNKTHAHDVVNAAIEIINFIEQHLNERKAQGKELFEIRIGIHSGPVVAGIVGVKKFAYDIWGDTVNTASRLESSGEPGKINISNSTYELIKNEFECTYRGKVNAKNKGEIDMYFVEHNT